jgi:hypothetical protein
MSPVAERDFPKGHPASADYDPKSPEAKEWARVNIHPLGERDFPVDHPKACDTPGNTNHIPVRAGVDPLHPELEEHTGATPEVAILRRAAYLARLPKAQETPTLPEGFVDTAKIAEDSAVDFVMEQGHDEDAARQIVREQGVDQILAAKATLGKGE